MSVRYDVLIVGGGHAGAQAAIALRQAKFTGTIAIVGEEAEFPYERPPLSKEYLSGEKNFDRILIRPPAFWADRGITMLLGRCVRSVDPEARQVTTDTDELLGYYTMIWATGGSPRRLSCDGHALTGLHTVRTRADADRMMEELKDTTHAVVIGGGYIGLEAAAALAKAGKHVVVLEALDRVLARVAGEPLSRFYEAEHRARGVDVRLDAAVECIVGDNGSVVGVRLRDGELLPAQMVIVGIGIIPATAPLLNAGAACDNGVLVDEFCRTTLADVFAIGDCAAHANKFAGGTTIRIESVQNANDQASVVAKVITGAPEPYTSVPWFWSNQYDLRLQTVGLSAGYDEVVVRGNIESRSFSIIYLRDRCVIALDCVNMTKDYVQGRALVARRMSIPAALLGDVSVPLKSHAIPV